MARWSARDELPYTARPKLDLQLKDQIGSFFYFPSLLLHKAAGGYGAIHVNNRPFFFMKEMPAFYCLEEFNEFGFGKEAQTRKQVTRILSF